MIDVLPLSIAVAGLVLYTVFAGADFGAGLWQLFAGRGDRGRTVRDYAHNAMAPVWEANHVWLILVLTVLWTGYPTFFGSVCSTQAIPLFLAAVGIVMRGLCYSLQSATEVPRERRLIDTSFAVSSILTPFMLGAMVGGIAAGEVPVGNATGDWVTSWLNPTSILCGTLAVAVGAFLAAVYLAADTRRLDDPSPMREAFRARALGAGVASGLLALVALLVAHHDAHRLFTGLTSGAGAAAAAVSAAAGVLALLLVWRNRFALARLSAAVAVAALLAGWAAAQRPDLLPGLTLSQASAGTRTMVAIVVSVVLGAVVLFPSLALLFNLTLRGDLDPGTGIPVAQSHLRDARRPPGSGRVAAILLIAGIALLTIADSGAAHAVGVVALVGAALALYTTIAPDQLATEDTHVHAEPPPRGPGW
jgi:cytochrome d ubiquinol oxidase subunit II